MVSRDCNKGILTSHNIKECMRSVAQRHSVYTLFERSRDGVLWGFNKRLASGVRLMTASILVWEMGLEVRPGRPAQDIQ